MRSPWRESRRRRAAWFGLILAVLAAHAMFGLRVVSSIINWNNTPEPRRIDITFSKRLQPTAAPTLRAPVAATPAPAPAPVPPPVRAMHPARPASAPASAVPPDAALAESHAALLRQALALAASAPSATPPASAASAVPVAAPVVAGASAAASGVSVAQSAEASSGVRVTVVGSGNVSGPVTTAPVGPALEWPPATRLTYTLKGLYRNGPLYGKASVEWRREGTHYQVQFDIHVSPFFDQQMFSDGQITAQGLSPKHYEESFKLPLLAPRVRRIEFLDDEVVLANGNRAIKLPQTQDGASQFVQFVWMFTAHPELLKPGNVVDLPLALNSNLRRWHYQVVGLETLDLDFGHIDAVHLKPVLDGPRRPNEYPFEIWTAPSLQYLPVRILVPIDDMNFADLSIDSMPLQAEPDPAGGPAGQQQVLH